jgi:hypothetical protein
VEALAELAHDPDRTVREKVAKNARTSPEALAELAHDPDWEVCWGVASNPGTSVEVLEAVSKGFRGWLVPIGRSLNGSYRHRSNFQYFEGEAHSPCTNDDKK